MTAPYAGPACPECGGEMWDNRGRKKRPNEPDFRCKNKPACPGKIQVFAEPVVGRAAGAALSDEEKAQRREHIAQRLEKATTFVAHKCLPVLRTAVQGAPPEALVAAAQDLVSTLMIAWDKQGVL